MLGVLLESRSLRQRRTGGAMLSVATHVAIVGAVTAFTVHDPNPVRQPDRPIPVKVAYPEPAPRTVQPRTTSPRRAVTSTTFVPPELVVDVPTITPVGLPPIQPSSGVSLDSLLKASFRVGAHSPSLGGGLLAEESGSAASDWRGQDLLMRIVKPAEPRYPDPLRRAGVSGHVLVRFTVDTLGRVDRTSVTVLESTHELFTSAVREALASIRFRPAEVGGHRVPAAAEMPFEFRIR